VYQRLHALAAARSSMRRRDRDHHTAAALLSQVGVGHPNLNSFSSQLLSHGQQSTAQGSSTTVSRSDIRLIQHFGLLGSWFGLEVALNWLFPYPLISPTRVRISSIAILYHEVPNPNLTIRNFCIAVSPEAMGCWEDFLGYRPGLCQSRIYCWPKQFYCRPRPAAHLLITCAA
jgi:hypothetical protein